jgi:hypothetical protein
VRIKKLGLIVGWVGSEIEAEGRRADGGGGCLEEERAGKEGSQFRRSADKLEGSLSMKQQEGRTVFPSVEADSKLIQSTAPVRPIKRGNRQRFAPPCILPPFFLQLLEATPALE